MGNIIAVGNLLIKVKVLPSSAQEMTTQNVRAVVEVVCLGEWKVQHRFRVGERGMRTEQNGR